MSNPVSDFDELAAQFYQETGVMRPGKSQPAGFGHSDEVRRQTWETWLERREKQQANRDGHIVYCFENTFPFAVDSELVNDEIQPGMTELMVRVPSCSVQEILFEFNTNKNPKIDVVLRRVNAIASTPAGGSGEV